MKLMPVGTGGAKCLAPTKGHPAAVVKTLSAANVKFNKGNKRPFNFHLKSPTASRTNLMTLNSPYFPPSANISLQCVWLCE